MFKVDDSLSFTMGILYHKTLGVGCVGVADVG